MAVAAATIALTTTWGRRRSVSIRAVAAGHTSIATTRIEPTASKDATVAAATRTMSSPLTAPAGMPWVVASPGSNAAMRSSLKRAATKARDTAATIASVTNTVRIDATVSVATGETGTPSYTEEMQSEDGLAPEDYPTATFMSETIEASDECDTCYIARGDLILREARLPVELPFSVVIEGDRAVADGTMVIERERFGVGGSSWGEAAAEVTVRVHIEADRAE